MRVLIVEDDVAIRQGLESALRDLGATPKAVGTAGEAARVLEEFDPEVLIVDLHLPDGDGHRGVPRGARGETGSRRHRAHGPGFARQRGRGPARRSVGLPAQTACGRRSWRSSSSDSRRGARSSPRWTRCAAELQETGKLGELIGKSPAMVKVFEAIRRVAVSNAPVLDHGPERHRQGGRGEDDPSPLPARVRALRRVQLRGDLADAHRERALRSRARLVHRSGQAPRRLLRGGQRRLALLDEITEMGPELQVKLLRVLEAKTLRRVGGAQDLRVDVRLISATNRDPLEAIKDEQASRRPLLPAERVPDRLAPAGGAARGHRGPRRALPQADRGPGDAPACRPGTPRRCATLEAYPWPGNVRELRNVVHRAHVMTEGDTIRPEVLEELLPDVPRPAAAAGTRGTPATRTPSSSTAKRTRKR